MLTRALTAVLAVLTLASCNPKQSQPSASPAPDGAQKVKLRLGYFPNLTHAPALIGAEKGYFEQQLAPTGGVELKTFNAGPAAVTALLADALDAAYIGPAPALNAYTRSRGEAIRVVSGAAEGGASLVVKPSINSAADLRGKKVASPQLGNSQDVALRTWLKSQGLTTNPDGGGEVSVVPQENAQTLATFTAGDIAGAWVPEPWATRLVDAGGKVLVDEGDLWAKRRFPTTVIVVRTEFLRRHPQAIKGLLNAHLQSVKYLADQPAEAQQAVNQGLEKSTGKALQAKLLGPAFAHLSFTTEIDPAAFNKLHREAVDLGLSTKGNLNNLFALDQLKQLVRAP